jgi:DNA topoisomerase-1
MNILIIESPGKQKTIQGFLGANWRVVASMGHIRGLTHDLNFLTNGYEPTYEFLKEKSKTITSLKEAAKGAAEIYLAADRDFEGEQIAYSVKVLLKLPNSVKRITFTEITEKAIRHAIANPGTIDMNRVHTQQARSLLDLLIGFTMSPLLWKHVAPSLSAGRCQIPSIRLVIEREDAILGFKTESSWKVSGEWIYQDGLYGCSFPGTMDDDLDEESAMNYMENVVSTNGIVTGNEVKPWTAAAPPPLMTSTLQQQASALFGMNPKTTMSIAQKLYEAGHITYMRTDKAVLSEEAVTATKAWIQENYGEEYVSHIATKKKKEVAQPLAQAIAGLTAQEAHEAIRPTHIEVTTVEGDGASLYRLIWQRTVQSQMAPARGETCTVKISLDDFPWTSRWKRTIFPGWQAVGRVAQIDEEEEEEEKEEDAWDKAIQIPVGASLPWKTMKASQQETKAQGRYTEATLIRELEKHGIGRPSTFASLLATIQEKHYVAISTVPASMKKVKEHSLQFGSLPIRTIIKDKKVAAEKNKMIPTDLGRSVVAFMLQHFEDIFNYNFTGQMEQRLQLVAEGKEEWKGVIHDTWTSYKDRFDGLHAAKREQTERKSEQIGEWNGEPIEKKSGKFGDYLKCGEISVPFRMESVEETVQRLEAKAAGKANAEVKEFKEYTVRTGQYGPYIMKKGLKKPRFISIPKGIDVATITEKDVDALYKAGLETKKTYKKKAF